MLHRDILISSVAATIAAAITMVARMAFWFGGTGGRDDENRGGAFGGIAMLILAPIAAMLIQMAISRSREYDADAASAKYVGSPYPLIGGLQKLETLVEADPHGRFAGHRPHVHHQAVHRRKPHAAVLDAPLDGGSDRTPAGDAMNEVRVNRKAADRAASGHPWIFTSDITDRDGAQPGGAVKVCDPRGRPLGTAHYSSTSQIAIRLLSRQIEEIGRDFYLRRIRAAEAHRRMVVHDSDAYRVVHAEADLLPGADRGSVRRLPGRADAQPGHGRREGRDRLVPRRDLRSRKASSRATTSRCARKEQLPLETRDSLGRSPANRCRSG